MFRCNCGRSFTTPQGLGYHKKFCGNYRIFLDGKYECKIGPDGKKVFIHREKMEQKLGRDLKSGELVHHKDEDKQNNESDNLELSDNSNHARHHFPIGGLQGGGGKSFGPKPEIQGSKNGFSKLTENQVSEIKQLLNLNESCSSIAEKYDVGYYTIYYIRTGKTWKHV